MLAKRHRLMADWCASVVTNDRVPSMGYGGRRRCSRAYARSSSTDAMARHDLEEIARRYQSLMIQATDGTSSYRDDGFVL
jgi:hypothetical protein